MNIKIINKYDIGVSLLFWCLFYIMMWWYIIRVNRRGFLENCVFIIDYISLGVKFVVWKFKVGEEELEECVLIFFDLCLF